MSARSRLFSLPVPGFVKKRCLALLARITAEAFDATAPESRRLSYPAYLSRYADFTSESAEALLRSGADPSPVQARLFSGARELGSRLRAALGLRTREEALKVARALYRMIRIDFRPCGSGRFTVGSCSFSSRYTPSVCRLISSMDAGLLSGLAGGGDLAFRRRITEGAAFCEGEIG
jgi:hypothetical protein